jgi:hypothetical protein
MVVVRDARGGTIEECRVDSTYVNVIRDMSYNEGRTAVDKAL